MTLARYVVETLVTLAAVVALAVMVLYAARKTGLGRPSGPLSLAGRLMLDARRAIYLVRVGNTLYVVGASEAGLTKLGELDPSEVGSLDAPRAAPAFRDVLARFRPNESESRQRTPSEPGSASETKSSAEPP